jgi:catechol 2,3-dioxygenase-like lactoylglutathione lyase family enzyme
MKGKREMGETGVATDMPKPGPGEVVGFFHAGITVSSMEKAMAFYRDALGLKVLAEAVAGGPEAERVWNLKVKEVKVAFLSVPGSDAVLELFEFENIERHSASARPCDFGAGHLCLYVADIDSMVARLHALGFSARSQSPGEFGTLTGGRARAIYTLDPDGYHVELYEVLE